MVKLYVTNDSKKQTKMLSTIVSANLAGSMSYRILISSCTPTRKVRVGMAKTIRNRLSMNWQPSALTISEAH